MKVHPQAHGAAPGSIGGLEIGASSGEGEVEGALVGLHGEEMDENVSGWGIDVLGGQVEFLSNLVGQGGPLQLRLPTLGPRQ